MTNTRFQMELRDGSVAMTKRTHEPQNDCAVYRARELYAYRTSFLVTLNAMSSAAIASVTSAAITPRAYDSRWNRHEDFCTDPRRRDLDRVPASRFGTCIQCGRIHDTAKRLRHVS